MKKPKPKIPKFGTLPSMKEQKSDGCWVDYENMPLYKPVGGKIEVMLSTDRRAPGVILPVYYFKKPYQEGYPDIWEQIKDLWVDPNIFHYGIRHIEDDYLFPNEITTVSFRKDRYGVLFTRTNLKITSRESCVTIFAPIAYSYYEVILSTDRNLRKMIDYCEKVAEILKEGLRD